MRHLFAQSKLKVEAARAAGLDTTSVFRKQQEKCRTELVESYLIDRQVMDSCARAIYQKMGLKARSGRVQVMQIFKRLPQNNHFPAFRRRKKRGWILYTG